MYALGAIYRDERVVKPSNEKGGAARPPMCSRAAALLIAAVVTMAMLADAAPAIAGGALSLLGGDGLRTVPLVERVVPASKAKTSDRIEGELHLNIRNGAPYPLQLRILYSSDATGQVQVLPRQQGPLTVIWGTMPKSTVESTAMLLRRYAQEIVRGTSRQSAAASAAAAAAVTKAVGVPPAVPVRTSIRRLARAIGSATRGTTDPASGPALASALSHALCPSDRGCALLDARDVQPLIELLRRDSSEVGAPTLDSERAIESLWTAVRTHSHPVIRAHTVLSLRLRLSVPDSSTPESLAGVVEVNGYTMRAARPRGAASFSLEGKVQSLGDVRFDPSTLVLRAVQKCVLFPCTSRPEGVVHLYGAGVGRLLEGSTKQSLLRGSLTLADKSVSVELQSLKRDHLHADSAVARLVVTETADAGKYTGALPISHLLAEAPALHVELESRVWEGIAVLLVLAGVLASGWVFEGYPRKRKRWLIRLAVKRVCRQLEVQIGGLPADARTEKDILIKRIKQHTNLAGQYRSDLYTELSSEDPVAILARADWAQSDEDFAPVEQATREFVEKAEGWAKELEDPGNDSRGPARPAGVAGAEAETGGSQSESTLASLGVAQLDKRFEPLALSLAVDPSGPEVYGRRNQGDSFDEARKPLVVEFGKWFVDLVRRFFVVVVLVLEDIVPWRFWRSHKRKRIRRRFQTLDRVLTLGVVVITSLAYTASIYNNEWGTVLDMVSAVGAGFTGSVVLKWGVLPIYNRISPTGSAPAGGAPDGG